MLIRGFLRRMRYGESLAGFYHVGASTVSGKGSTGRD